MRQTSNLIDHYQIQSFDSQKIFKEFKKSIHDNVFHVHKDSLLLNCDLVPFDHENWKFRPDLFCLNYYEQPNFFPVILICNKLKSRFEFLPENFPTSRNLIISPKHGKIIMS